MKKQRYFIKITNYLCFFVLFAVLTDVCLANGESACIKYDDVKGSGNYPYNFRDIDNRLFAGGSLFNPVSKSNSDEKVVEYLRLLKSKGVSSILLLHVPLKDSFTPRLELLCEKEKLKLIKMRMNAEQVPNEEQTKLIMEAIDSGTYAHCMWGCDRTGAIIGKYLRTKGYTGREALEAIVNNGSHSGKLGGFKKKSGNRNLLLYFWPEVASESPCIYQEFLSR